MTYHKLAGAVLAGALLLTGCGATTEEPVQASDQLAMEVEQPNGTVNTKIGDSDDALENAEQEQVAEAPETGSVNATETDPSLAEKTEDKEATYPEIDVQTVRPNELGEVMVIMYHGLTGKNSAYTRTVASFRADLEELYENNFRPISFQAYLDGTFDVGPGMTPFVLTFDDGNRSNFNVWEEDGEIIVDPDSAVGIMEAFAAEHPDFDPQASFFLNGGTPFGQAEYVDWKLNFLLENGYGIGNHSWGHADLTKLDVQGIQKSLGRNVNALEDQVPGLTVDTLALPFGKRPKDPERYDAVTRGTYDDRVYTHRGILLVGWKPDVSPLDTRFDPLDIMRVQSGDGEAQMRDWLDDYYAHPYKRFVSDGNPNVITIPESKLDKLNMDMVGDREVRTYVPED